MMFDCLPAFVIRETFASAAIVKEWIARANLGGPMDDGRHGAALHGRVQGERIEKAERKASAILSSNTEEKGGYYFGAEHPLRFSSFYQILKDVIYFFLRCIMRFLKKGGLVPLQVQILCHLLRSTSTHLLVPVPGWG